MTMYCLWFIEQQRFGCKVTSIVCDTDVWSFLFKKDTRAELYRAHLEKRVLCISFQTVAELYQWAEKADWGTARRRQRQLEV